MSPVSYTHLAKAQTQEFLQLLGPPGGDPEPFDPQLALPRPAITTDEPGCMVTRGIPQDVYTALFGGASSGTCPVGPLPKVHAVHRQTTCSACQGLANQLNDAIDRLAQAKSRHDPDQSEFAAEVARLSKDLDLCEQVLCAEHAGAGGYLGGGFASNRCV